MHSLRSLLLVGVSAVVALPHTRRESSDCAQSVTLPKQSPSSWDGRPLLGPHDDSYNEDVGLKLRFKSWEENLCIYSVDALWNGGQAAEAITPIMSNSYTRLDWLIQKKIYQDVGDLLYEQSASQREKQWIFVKDYSPQEGATFESSGLKGWLPVTETLPWVRFFSDYPKTEANRNNQDWDECEDFLNTMRTRVVSKMAWYAENTGIFPANPSWQRIAVRKDASDFAFMDWRPNNKKSWSKGSPVPPELKDQWLQALSEKPIPQSTRQPVEPRGGWCHANLTRQKEYVSPFNK